MCPLYDFPLARLREYQPPLTRQPDFEPFWAETLAEAKGPLHDEVQPVDYPAPKVRVFDVHDDGFCGGRVGGWYLLLPEANGSRW